jgi:hypothetical protein
MIGVAIISKPRNIDGHIPRYRVLARRFEELMKAVKTHVGRCDTCGEPAAYAQLLPAGRSFRFCEQHVPLLVKKQADAAAAANEGKEAPKK